MATLKVFKALAALPSSLVANALYAVRVGTGFDLHITDSTGLIAYKANGSGDAASNIDGGSAPPEPAAMVIDGGAA